MVPLLVCISAVFSGTPLVNGEVWRDTSGKMIQAHGGHMLYQASTKTYYWYGEDKSRPNEANKGGLERVPLVGIHAYSSQNLSDWKDEGVVLSAVDEPTHDLNRGAVLERPKVLFCKKTKQYVMFTHVDSADYKRASVGFAVSKSPTGPFQYLYSLRPLGEDSRDMTVFQDSDGKAYLVSSSRWNSTLQIAELSADYLSLTGRRKMVFENQSREAATLFKADKYYAVTSGCTGWAPNPAMWHSSSAILGDWQSFGNPCVGTAKQRSNTYGAQSAFVVPIDAKAGKFLFFLDRWNPKNLQDSRYLALPLFVKDGKVRVEWSESLQESLDKLRQKM